MGRWGKRRYRELSFISHPLIRVVVGYWTFRLWGEPSPTGCEGIEKRNDRGGLGTAYRTPFCLAKPRA